MKRTDLIAEMQKVLYIEDTGAIDIVHASSLATRLSLGNPVWLVIVGVSSGGKSQIIRPLAVADPVFVKRVDDLTENTLISGMNTEETSLLAQVGAKGILVVSDLTAIFSKSDDAKHAILGQLRLVYDGEFTKFFGNRKPFTWKGELGVVAGCTPSIYQHFEKVADMGERFMYYRMKHIDPEKAVTKALKNTMHGKRLDEHIAELYDEYQKAVVKSVAGMIIPAIDLNTEARIIKASLFAAKLRTPIHLDFRTDQVDRIPFSEMPMRVALQLGSIARGLMAMEYHETKQWTLREEFITILEWCAYSLANEERRAIIRTLASADMGAHMDTQDVADTIGLETVIVRRHLQQLASINVCTRHSQGNSLTWSFTSSDDYDLIRKLECL